MSDSKFQELPAPRRKADERGTVMVSIRLYNRGGSYKYVKGNITAWLHVNEAKVSEVEAALRKALFGE